MSGNLKVRFGSDGKFGVCGAIVGVKGPGGVRKCKEENRVVVHAIGGVCGREHVSFLSGKGSER